MTEVGFFRSIGLSFRRMWSVIAATALDWLRSPPAVFFTFIYPIIMILLFGYIFGAGTDQGYYSLYYLNDDVYQVGDQVYPFNPTDALLANLGLDNDTLSDELNLKLYLAEGLTYTDDVNTSNWMKANEIPYLIIIPSGWSASVNESKVNTTAPKSNIKYFYDPSYQSAYVVQSTIEYVLQEMQLEEFGIPIFMQVDINVLPSQEELGYIDFYVPGIIMVTVSTSGMMGMVSIITDGRRSGRIYKLASTPIKKWEWALAQEVWQVVISLAISFLTIMTGWLAFDFKIAHLNIMIIPILIFGSMTFAGLALILARFIKRPEAAMAATFSFVFPQMFLSGAIMPLDIMPKFMQTIAQIFPLYYIGQAMNATMLESTFNQVWLPFGVTVAMGTVFFIVGSLLTIWRKGKED
ncbi:MAG: ABC transporter permease [Candidatus Heimdallarchaeota archaeon]